MDEPKAFPISNLSESYFDGLRKNSLILIDCFQNAIISKTISHCDYMFA